jgi:hypothetical protein
VAKGKPAKSNKSSSAVAAKSKTPAPKAVPAAAAAKPAAENSLAFTGIAIGHAAGEVWGCLSGGEPRTIADIKKSVKVPGELVVAAIGWLAREEKLDFVTSGKTVKIGLR